MLETAELLAFATTVDAMSISRAARELRIPRATLGRRLAVLEEKLGVRLLRRTTRSLVMTDAGDSSSTPPSPPKRACAAPTAQFAATCACRSRT